MLETEKQAINQISLQVDKLVEKFSSSKNKTVSPRFTRNANEVEGQQNLRQLKRVTQKEQNDASNFTQMLMKQLNAKDQQLNQLRDQKRSFEVEKMRFVREIENYKSKIIQQEQELAYQYHKLKQFQDQQTQYQHEISVKQQFSQEVQEECKKYANFIIGKSQDSKQLSQIVENRFEQTNNLVQLLERKEFQRFSLKALKLISDLFVYILSTKSHQNISELSISRYLQDISHIQANNNQSQDYFNSQQGSQKNLSRSNQLKTERSDISQNKKQANQCDLSFQNCSNSISQVYDYPQYSERKIEQSPSLKTNQFGTPQFLKQEQQSQTRTSNETIEENKFQLRNYLSTKASSLGVKQQIIQKYLDHKKNESEKAQKLLSQIKNQNERLRNLNSSSQNTPRNDLNLSNNLKDQESNYQLKDTENTQRALKVIIPKQKKYETSNYSRMMNTNIEGNQRNVQNDFQNLISTSKKNLLLMQKQTKEEETDLDQIPQTDDKEKVKITLKGREKEKDQSQMDFTREKDI